MYYEKLPPLTTVHVPETVGNDEKCYHLNKWSLDSLAVLARPLLLLLLLLA